MTEPVNNRKGQSPTGRTVAQLNAKQKYLLCEFVREYYSLKAIPDKEFSALATEKLGFPVSVSSVTTSREVFDIPSTRTTSLSSTKDHRLSAIEANLEALSLAVKQLKHRIDVYIDGAR